MGEKSYSYDDELQIKTLERQKRIREEGRQSRIDEIQEAFRTGGLLSDKKAPRKRKKKK